MNAVLSYALPAFMTFLLIIGCKNKVDLIKEFTAGAMAGLKAALGLAPVFLLIMPILAMLRGSGFIELLSQWLSPVCSRIGIPAEIIPLALLRPVSGSGSIAQLSQMLDLYGADSLVGRCSSVLAASTETTLYTFSVYSSHAGIKKMPSALIAGLLADFCAFLFSVLFVRLFLA